MYGCILLYIYIMHVRPNYMVSKNAHIHMHTPARLLAYTHLSQMSRGVSRVIIQMHATPISTHPASTHTRGGTYKARSTIGRLSRVYCKLSPRSCESFNSSPSSSTTSTSTFSLSPAWYACTLVICRILLANLIVTYSNTLRWSADAAAPVRFSICPFEMRAHAIMT